MKLALAFLMCCLLCASASPSCDESQAYNCSGSKKLDSEHFYPETSSDLIYFCRHVLLELDCQIDFTKRCPNTLLGANREGLENYRDAFKKLCDIDLPLRQKFLDKGSCLNKEMQEAENRCSETVTEKDWCKRFDPVLICAEEEVNRLCGSDGKEIYAELFKPKYSLKKVFCGFS